MAKKTVLVRDLMREDMATAPPDASVAKVRDLMYENWIRHVAVVDAKGALVGLVSHRDLLREAGIESYERPVWVEQERLERMSVSEVMRTLVETASPDDSIAAAGEKMLAEKFGCLPVVAKGRIVGMLSEADFVRWVVGKTAPENKAAAT